MAVSKRITSVIYIYEDGSFSHVDLPRPDNIPTLTNAVKTKPPGTSPLKDVPITPTPTVRPSWIPPQETSWYGNCPKCGLKLDKVMGYVCHSPGCPTGLAGPYCAVGQ